MLSKLMFQAKQVLSYYAFALFSTNKYDKKVIDFNENPKNVGSLDPKKENVGTGLVGS